MLRIMVSTDNHLVRSQAAEHAPVVIPDLQHCDPPPPSLWDRCAAHAAQLLQPERRFARPQAVTAAKARPLQTLAQIA